MMEETKKVIVGKMISLDKRKWNGIYTWRSCTEEWWENVAIHLRDEALNILRLYCHIYICCLLQYYVSYYLITDYIPL